MHQFLVIEGAHIHAYIFNLPDSDVVRLDLPCDFSLDDLLQEMRPIFVWQFNLAQKCSFMMLDVCTASGKSRELEVSYDPLDWMSLEDKLEGLACCIHGALYGISGPKYMQELQFLEQLMNSNIEVVDTTEWVIIPQTGSFAIISHSPVEFDFSLT